MAKRMSKYAIIEQVVTECQATKISMLLGTKRRRVLLDVYSASRLLKMFDGAPIENREKLEALPWDRLVSISWGKK